MASTRFLVSRIVDTGLLNFCLCCTVVCAQQTLEFCSMALTRTSDSSFASDTEAVGKLFVDLEALHRGDSIIGCVAYKSAARAELSDGYQQSSAHRLFLLSPHAVSNLGVQAFKRCVRTLSASCKAQRLNWCIWPFSGRSGVSKWSLSGCPAKKTHGQGVLKRPASGASKANNKAKVQGSQGSSCDRRKFNKGVHLNRGGHGRPSRQCTKHPFKRRVKFVCRRYKISVLDLAMARRAQEGHPWPDQCTIRALMRRLEAGNGSMEFKIHFYRGHGMGRLWPAWPTPLHVNRSFRAALF